MNMNTQLQLLPSNHLETSEGEHLLLSTLHMLACQPNFGLIKQYSETLAALITALRAKDPQLYLHSYRVQRFTHQLMQTLQLSKEEAWTIKMAALLHDIGKIGIHDAILRKASRLTPEEFESVKEHPARGAFILSQIPPLNNIVPIVYCHHERWDGNGYPNGLSKQAIPLGARIVAIADAFEVMTSGQRAYQNPRSIADAIQELRRCSDTQFDRSLVTIFCASLTSEMALAS